MPTPWGRRFRAERTRSNTRKGVRGEHRREPSTLFPPPFVNCPLINCLKCTTENVFLHENYVEVYILANTERFEKVPIEKLVPYIRNARTHSKEQILQIRASLREFGFVTPVIIDEKYRGKGIGKKLISTIVSDNRFSSLLGILVTRDAHGLYEHFGFVKDSERAMTRRVQNRIAQKRRRSV